jgi:hypothetical protein
MTDINHTKTSSHLMPTTAKSPTGVNAGLTDSFNGAFKQFNEATGGYVDRRGLSNGTVGDALSMVFEGAFHAADTFGPNNAKDGVIHPGVIQNVMVNAIKTAMKPDPAKASWNIDNVKRSLNQVHIELAVKTALGGLPANVPVPSNEKVEALVGNAVNHADKSGDGRLSEAEMESLKDVLPSLIRASLDPNSKAVHCEPHKLLGLVPLPTKAYGEVCHATKR